MAAVCALALCGFPLLAQDSTPQSAVPIDLTGYWVSIVTEDWRTRMLTAPRGDYYGLPITDQARSLALQYTPKQADACLNYHAPTILRAPGRLHITWSDANTLKLETDAGEQTRLFPFARAEATPMYSAGTGAADAPISTAAPTMQGVSRAEWQTPQATNAYWGRVPAQDPNTPGFPGIVREPAPPDTRQLGGSLKVVTSRILPGFLRNNGVPFSENTVLTEYFDVHAEKNGDVWLVVTSIVEDTTYLAVPWVTTSHFRREPDGSKWDPQPCELILPSN